MITILLVLSSMTATNATPDSLSPKGVDVNGDGCADVALVGSGSVHILSGATGEEIVRAEMAEILKPYDHIDRGYVSVDFSLFRSGAEGAVRLLGMRKDGSVAVQNLRGEVDFSRTVGGFGLAHQVEYLSDLNRGRSEYLIGGRETVRRDGAAGEVWAHDVVPLDLEVLLDVDGDGFRDFALVESHSAGYFDYAETKATIRSGRDGSLIRQIAEGCRSIGLVGDVDGDGIADVAVGLRGGRVDDEVFVYSSVDGRFLYSLTNPSEHDPFTHFGSAIVYLGDVDDDGVGDFAVGAYKDDPNDWEVETGSVSVFSGRTGTRMHKLFGPPGGCLFSFQESGVSSPGDADGDGAADLLITSGRACPTVLVSGRTGAVLWVPKWRAGSFHGSRGWIAASLEDHPAGVSRLTRRGG